ncbi:hypothetical protein RI367_006677 [Sorochytrium milnesiophthora]
MTFPSLAPRSNHPPQPQQHSVMAGGGVGASPAFPFRYAKRGLNFAGFGEKPHVTPPLGAWSADKSAAPDATSPTSSSFTSHYQNAPNLANFFRKHASASPSGKSDPPEQATVWQAARTGDAQRSAIQNSAPSVEQRGTPSPDYELTSIIDNESATDGEVVIPPPTAPKPSPPIPVCPAPALTLSIMKRPPSPKTPMMAVPERWKQPTPVSMAAPSRPSSSSIDIKPLVAGGDNVITQLKAILTSQAQAERECKRQSGVIQQLQESNANQKAFTDVTVTAIDRAETLSAHNVHTASMNAARVEKLQKEVRLLLMVALQLKSATRASGAISESVSEWMSNTKAALQDASSCNEQLKKQLVDAQTQANDARQQITELITQKDHGRQQLEDAERARERMEHELQAQASLVSTLESAISALRDQTETLSAQLSTNVADLSEAREAQEQVKRQHLDEQARSAVKEAQLQQQLSSISTQLSCAQHNHELSQKQIDTFNDQVASLVRALNGLQELPISSQAVAQSIRGLVLDAPLLSLQSLLLGIISALERLESNHQAAQGGLQQRIDKLQKKEHALEQQLRETRQRAECEQQQLQDEHKRAISAKDTQRVQLEASLHLANAEKAQLLSERDQMQKSALTEFASLGRTLTTALDDCKQLCQRAASGDACLQALQSHFERTQVNVQSMQAAADQKLTDFLKECQDLQAVAQEGGEHAVAQLSAQVQDRDQQIREQSCRISGLEEKLSLNDKQLSELGQDLTASRKHVAEAQEQVLLLSAQLGTLKAQHQHETEVAQKLQECRRQLTDCAQRDLVGRENQIKRLEHQLHAVQQLNEQLKAEKEQQPATSSLGKEAPAPSTDRTKGKLQPPSSRTFTGITTARPATLSSPVAMVNLVDLDVGLSDGEPTRTAPTTTPFAQSRKTAAAVKSTTESRKRAPTGGQREDSARPRKVQTRRALKPDIQPDKDPFAFEDCVASPLGKRGGSKDRVLTRKQTLQLATDDQL